MPDEFVADDGSTLTPAQKTEAAALFAQPQPPETGAPVATMLDPYQPGQYVGADDKPLALTPKQKTEYRRAAGVVDPMLDLKPEDLVALAREPNDDPAKKFDIFAAWKTREAEIKTDPEAVHRVAAAWRQYKDSTNLGDVANPAQMAENALSGVSSLVSSTAKMGWNLVQPHHPEGSPEDAESRRNLMEAEIGQKVALQGLASQGGSILSKLARSPLPVSSFGGERIAPPAITPQSDVLALMHDSAQADNLQAMIKGEGADWLPKFQKSLDIIKANGLSLRPEEIQKYAAGSPLTYYIFGKAFGLMGKGAPALISKAELDSAGAALAKGVSAGVTATAQGAAWAAPKIAKVAPLVGAVEGTVKGGPLGGITGWAVGTKVKEKLLGAGVKLAKVAEAGQELAGAPETPVTSSYTQLAKSILQNTPHAAYEVGKGYLFDEAMGLTADTPEDAKQVGIGTFFGLMGAGRALGAPVLSGLLVGPRGYGQAKAPPRTGFFPGLESVQDNALAAEKPGQVQRANFLTKAAQDLPNSDGLFVGPRPTDAIDARAKQLLEPPASGEKPTLITPEQAQIQAAIEVDPFAEQLVSMGYSSEQAATIASQDGGALKNVQGHNLYFFRDVAAAPHEIAGHGWEAVLGESAMRAFDQQIQSDPKYANQWDAYGQSYARRLGWKPGSPESWQDAVLRISGWGKLNEAEKGAPLTPTEQNEVVNRYISREIYAENEDAAFKHKGGYTDEDKSLPARIARTIGNFMSFMGRDPLSGQVAEYSGWPLSYDLIKGVSKARAEYTAGQPVELPKLPAKAFGFGSGGLPSTPAQQQKVVRDAQAAAAGAPDTPLSPGAASQKEILGTIAEAMAKESGVKLDMLSAPDQPAAAIGQDKRTRAAQIEFNRTAPQAAKSLWSKLFTPMRVLVISRGKFQVLGYTPEVFAANAHRFAGSVADMIAKDAAHATLSPYPIDPTTRSFTTEGWQQLYQDTAIYVKNQMAGRTGFSAPLVVPRFQQEHGIWKPQEGPSAGALSEDKSQLINLLFGGTTPKTPRITGGKMPLNVAGAEVREATMKAVGLPSGIEKPATPRAREFTGAVAEKLGIVSPGESRPIVETNPLRNRLEEAATKTGVPEPSMISAQQRLNLENILKAEHAPEQPQFRGNTLALAAGFQPPPEGAQFQGPKPTEEIEKRLSDASSWVKDDQAPRNPADELTPALRDPEGKVFPGVAGKTHADIYNSQPTLEDKLMLQVSQPEHGFLRGDEFLNRQQAAEHVGETTPLQSEHLRELQGTPAQFQAPRVNAAPAEEAPELLAERIKGGAVSVPQPLYHLAAEQEGNPWVRRSADPQRSAQPDNAGRTLLVQMSSDLINPESLGGAAKDEAARYYDMLYSGARPGYARMKDFWEIPQWIGFASKFLPDADVYVVRDLAKAKDFLNQAGYDRVAFSALDTNKALIRELVKDYQGKVDVGGYVDPKTFEDLPNVKWHDNMESMAKESGLPYVNGVDYRHFQSSDVIPRLTMSAGCRHKCSFCTIEKKVVETAPEVVQQQADEIAKLGTKLVYLNDKTFGQAGNYQDLSGINQQILAQNPDFKGFVVQTTAAQLKTMPADWLAKSGIKFVELGVESYNDPILKSMHKPATESMINQVVDKLRQNHIALIPNIIIGHPLETAETYAHTLKFLRDNKDIISHANVYNLALYKDTELGKQVLTGADGDFNENVLEKSFHTNPEIHRQFAGDVYGLASEMLQGIPSGAQFQAPKPLEEGVQNLDDMPDTKEALFPATSLPVHGAVPKFAEENRLQELYGKGEDLTGDERDELSNLEQAKQQWLPLQAVAKEVQPHEAVPEVSKLISETTTLPLDQWNEMASAYPGGVSAYSHKVGMAVKSQADLLALRNAHGTLDGMVEPAIKAGDMDLAMALASKTQALREAYESATGRTMDGTKDTIETTRKIVDPNYQPPLPPGAQFQAPREEEKKGPVYYSQLGRVIDSKFSGASMPTDQLATVLRNPQNGVKADELKWSGLDDFLAGKQRVTKEEVQDYLKQNQVQVREITKGAGPEARWNPLYGRNTKFENYQLPGGENYREILFTLPVDTAAKQQGQDEYNRLVKQGVPLFEAHRRAYGAVPQAEQFKSPHWDEPNVVAHTRVNDRTDSEGKSGLFAEEIQSDWHQTGRKEGYASDASKRISARYVGGEWQILDTQGNIISYISGPPSMSEAEVLKSSQKYESSSRVPDAPFKTTWHELVLRRLVRLAAEEGKDWLGWTTGDQQAERYDLSKSVKQINYTPETGWLNAVDLSGSRVLDKTVKPEELETYIGKEAAAKIREQPGAIKTLRGQDLKVGGEGMKGFYDKILVDYANKFGKKFGAKVEDRRIDVVDPAMSVEKNASGNYRVRRGGMLLSSRFKTEKEAWDFAEQEGGGDAPIHSLPITPEMKASVLREGVAQFEPAREESEGFKKWTAGAKMIPADSPAIHDVQTGMPTVMVGYHGTTRDFSVFDPNKGEAEGHFGKGIYVTTSQEDAKQNYAGLGPDLRNKIDLEAERMAGADPADLMRKYGISRRIAQRASGGGQDNPTARQVARDKFMSHGGATMKVFVKLENPLVLGGKGEPYWDLNYDETTGQETGKLADLQEALNDSAADHGERGVPLPEALMDGARASAVIDALRKSYALMQMTDDQGNLVGHEIIRDALERMGYDGIVDRTVDMNFGSQLRIGGKPVGMVGMTPDTAHIVAFRSEQVKSATGNRGTFDPTNPDIQYLPPREDHREEQIIRAAVRVPNGKVYTAPDKIGSHRDDTHSDAVAAAREDSDDPGQTYEEGFVTTSGRFVDRKAGYRVALRSGQFSEEDYRGHHAGAKVSETNPSLETDETARAMLRKYQREQALAKGIPFEGQAQAPKTYIVRHGSTELNAEDLGKDKIRGFLNVPLSDKGKKEALALAEGLKGSGITTVITSDLKRARQTADAIADVTGAKVVEEPGLRPWHFGPTIEGKPTEKMLPVIKDLVEHPDKVPKGGESFNTFKDRFIGAFHEAQDKYPDENTALVTHYRGTKLLDAWRAEGTDNDAISHEVFEAFDKDKKPATYDVVDKTGAQFQVPKENAQEKENSRVYQRRSATHGWWMNPQGNLLPLTTGEHATDAIKILGIPASRQEKNDAYGQTALKAYHELTKRGWRAILPQTFFRSGQPVSTLLFRGGEETPEAAAATINKAQRNSLERLAIKHDLVINNNLGDSIYRPPTAPAAGEEPPMMGQAQYQAPFAHEAFDKELEKIRSGVSGGATFSPSGEIWQPAEKKVDLVSLASVNLPLGELTRENVTSALGKFSDLLDEPGVVAGLYAFSKDGKPTVSVDLNAVVPKKYRENTLDFAKKNDQVAVWDVEHSKEVSAGGKGNTKLQSPGEILDALNDLHKGKPVDVDEIMRQNRETGAPAEEPGLPGMGVGRKPLSTAAASNMTKADLAAYYPESVTPRTRNEKLPSEITASPLFKAASNPARAFGRKLTEFAKEWLDHPSFQSGLKWYSEFVPRLKKVFGEHAPLMAELLAGTSPNEIPVNNYAMALDALEGFKAGRFNKQIAKFEEGLDKFKDGSWKKWLDRELKAGKVKNAPETPTEETFLQHWVDKYDLKPKKTNGKLYGLSSDTVLRIFARKWLGNTPGLKTQNFVLNLLGLGHEATIDLWADRTMRRIGYSGSQARWRILPKNATSVSDADFKFSQAAFADAAKELGIEPDALQGGLWFAEKQLWADNGWGRLDLGDYRTEIAKTEMLQKGIQQIAAAKKAAGKAPAAEQPELLIEPRKLKP